MHYTNFLEVKAWGHQKLYPIKMFLHLSSWNIDINNIENFGEIPSSSSG